MTETRDSKTAALQATLQEWYTEHQRQLPWRQDNDAYRVWVSEIMLQQTRVAAVLEHYRLFLEAFPTVDALARASEGRVLALWSGLGYYRRARLLHQAAKVVVGDFGGVIPREAESLRKLPGVGRYTAAAIASIAYGEPVAVVDGNVERVLTRMDGEQRADAMLWKRAQELLDLRHPGNWNQAMMELGATVCTPRSPQCALCPVLRWCRSPGAETRKPQAGRKRVRMARALIQRSHRVYLVQRPADAAKMAGMWELPECPPSIARQNTDAEPEPGVKRGSVDCGAKELCVVRHSITDTDYEVRVMRAGLKLLGAKDKKAGRWVSREATFELPLTGLTRKILRKLGLR